MYSYNTVVGVILCVCYFRSLNHNYYMFNINWVVVD